MTVSMPAMMSFLALRVPPFRLTASPLAACRVAAVSLLAGVLGSCGDPVDKFAPACPGLSFLKDAADVTRFRPGGQDVTDMVLDGKLTDVPATCRPGERTADRSTVDATMNVVVDLTRGPAAKDRAAVVTYFVAVTEGDRVLDEQDYNLNVSFPANIDHASFRSEDIKLAFPVSKQKSAAAYHVYVGFRLAPDELAYNRRRGAR